MTNLEQQTALALHLGYTFKDKEIMYDGMEIKFRVWKTPEGGGMEKKWPPNYPEDLNAIFDAIRSLTPKQKDKIVNIIGWSATRQILDTSFIASATAGQWCRATLQTLNLWKS